MTWDWSKFFIKLTSRKFWIAVCGIVTGCVLIYKGEGTVEVVSGVASTLISIIGYIWAETTVDAASSVTTSTSTALGNAIAEIVTAVVNAVGTAKDASEKSDTETASETVAATAQATEAVTPSATATLSTEA